MENGRHRVLSKPRGERGQRQDGDLCVRDDGEICGVPCILGPDHVEESEAVREKKGLQVLWYPLKGGSDACWELKETGLLRAGSALRPAWIDGQL